MRDGAQVRECGAQSHDQIVMIAGRNENFQSSSGDACAQREHFIRYNNVFKETACTYT